MPRPNSAVTPERVSSCSTSSGWTPETGCSWTSQECTLRCASRIAWTAIQDAPGRRAWLLLDVARPVPAYEREGCISDAVSSFLMVEQAKFARLKAPPIGLLALRFAALQSVLTRKFLPALNSSWLETAFLPVTAGREVSAMREYVIRVFVPQEHVIQAKDDAEALEKVGAFYKELYKKDFLTLIEPLPGPDDVY